MCGRAVEAFEDAIQSRIYELDILLVTVIFRFRNFLVPGSYLLSKVVSLKEAKYIRSTCIEKFNSVLRACVVVFAKTYS